jgi:hypothetical protein
MKELDLLKKIGKKNENSFEQISEPEIYQMIHKNHLHCEVDFDY